MFSYPFDSVEILRKYRNFKKKLLADGRDRIVTKIAVLGGSTTKTIVDILELFLLDQGIQPIFYQSEYGRYWQDAMFGNSELDAFNPDIIYIHTSSRNINEYPSVNMSATEIDELFNRQCAHFEDMWTRLSEKKCIIIQNNFEMPFFRLLGNKDAADIHGRTNYLMRLNSFFYEYTSTHSNFYINDINYMSGCYGLKKWSDPLYWNMYKYCMCIQAIPEFAFNLSHIIKAIYGKNKKVLALDLDNTLWGGVIGDDGVENIQLGQETAVGEIYCEFQKYIKSVSELGILLTVCSKNEKETALSGLRHPSSLLSPEDFVLIKANWENKDKNILETSEELNVLTDSIVLIDDNNSERELVRNSVGIEAPDIDKVENYINIIDFNGYFETTSLLSDDINRNEMYKQNALRKEQRKKFSDYGEYLRSLEMKCEIDKFSPVYLQRIAQLTNKTNQFNLTARRYTAAEIEALCNNAAYICLYGKLKDKFGDNGIVSVVIGKIKDDTLDVELWLMSCRVLKRTMEYAMLDAVVNAASQKNLKSVIGHYYPTVKNALVKDLYENFGFTLIDNDHIGNKKYILDIAKYKSQNKYIQTAD